VTETELCAVARDIIAVETVENESKEKNGIVIEWTQLVSNIILEFFILHKFLRKFISMGHTPIHSSYSQFSARFL